MKKKEQKKEIARVDIRLNMKLYKTKQCIEYDAAGYEKTSISVYFKTLKEATEWFCVDADENERGCIIVEEKEFTMPMIKNTWHMEIDDKAGCYLLGFDEPTSIMKLAEYYSKNGHRVVIANYQ